MSNRLLLDRVQRAIDRLDALGLNDEHVDTCTTAIIDALREVRDDLEHVLTLPASFLNADPDWAADDRRQCGRVAHLI